MVARKDSIPPAPKELWQDPALEPTPVGIKQKPKEEMTQQEQSAPVPASTPVPQPNPQQADNFVSSNQAQPITSAGSVETTTSQKSSTQSTTKTTPTTPVPKPVSHNRKEADAELKAQQRMNNTADSLIEVAHAAHNIISGNIVDVAATPETAQKDEDKENKVGNVVSTAPTPKPATTSTEQKQDAYEYVRPPVHHQELAEVIAKEYTTQQKEAAPVPDEPEIESPKPTGKHP